MPGHYVISKWNGRWAIAVDGSMLLICERKKDAVRAVRQATARAAAAAAAGPPAPRCHAEPKADSPGPAERIFATAR